MEVSQSKATPVEYEKYSNKDIDRLVAQENYMAPVFQDLLAQPFLKRERPTILDVGCGNGFFSEFFVKKGWQVHGVDGSPYGLEEAAKRGLSELKRIEDFDKMPLPYAEGSYSLVLCKDLLEHLYSPKRLVQEMVRVLHPEGRVLILVPNHFPLYLRLKFLLTAKLDTAGFFPDASEWDLPHIRFFTAKGLLQGLYEGGLVVDKNYCGHFPCLPPLTGRLPGVRAILSHLAQKFPTGFANALVFSCKKRQ